MHSHFWPYTFLDILYSMISSYFQSSSFSSKTLCIKKKKNNKKKASLNAIFPLVLMRFGTWVKFFNIGIVIFSGLLYMKINDVYFPQEAKRSLRPVSPAQHNAGIEHVSVGNLIQNSNVAPVESPNVAFKNIDRYSITLLLF